MAEKKRCNNGFPQRRREIKREKKVIFTTETRRTRRKTKKRNNVVKTKVAFTSFLYITVITRITGSDKYAISGISGVTAMSRTGAQTFSSRIIHNS
jgi:hypothetical protein